MKSWDTYELDKFAKIFFEIEFSKNSNDIKLEFNKSYNDLKQKLGSIEIAVRHANKNNWKNIGYILNLSGFVLMISLDLKIYAENLLLLEGFGKKELQFKNTCVLIFESLEDLEQLIGKKFFEICDNIGISINTINELKEKKKALSKFKNEHQSSLKSIRTIVGAHKDHDFLLQLDTINSFSHSGFISLVAKFDNIINELAIPLQKTILESLNNSQTTLS